MRAAGLGALLLLLLRAAPCPGQLAGDTGERPRGMAASGGVRDERGCGDGGRPAAGVRGGDAAPEGSPRNPPKPQPCRGVSAAAQHRWGGLNSLCRTFQLWQGLEIKIQ